tara:strand:+ start:2928 stop:3107 length:180 start_codon:yes stop_codon:yes gene_type:complete
MDIELENEIVRLENKIISSDNFIGILKNMYNQDRLISERLMEIDQMKDEIKMLKSQTLY